MGGTEPLWWRRGPGVRGITRLFVINRVQWRAFEYAIGTGLTNIWLMFASEGVWRRVRPFPANWAEQDDAALIGICGSQSVTWSR